MKIKYKAYTQNGEKVSGILDTESEQIAYNILEKKQLLPYHIEEIENKTFEFSINISFKVKTQDLITFTKQLSSLLNAGIPLRKALLIQKEQTNSKKLRNAYWVWKINRKFNKLNFFDSFISLFFISFNSIRKYGLK